MCVLSCDSMEYSLPDSSVHGIFQTRILEWVAISYSRGVFPTQGSNPHLLRWFNTEPRGKFLQLEIWHHKDLQDLLELTPKKDVLFTIGDWNAKIRSQETPGVTGKFGLGVQNEAEQRLKEFCQENTLVIANNLCQQYKRRLYTWTSPKSIPKSDWLYYLQPKMEKLYKVSKNMTGSWLWRRS